MAYTNAIGHITLANQKYAYTEAMVLAKRDSRLISYTSSKKTLRLKLIPCANNTGIIHKISNPQRRAPTCLSLILVT